MISKAGGNVLNIYKSYWWSGGLNEITQEKDGEVVVVESIEVYTAE